MSVTERGTRTGRWIGTLVLATSLIAGPVVAQDEMSTQERLALSPSAADRQARRDLLSVLEPVTGFTRGNRRRLNDLVFTTRPYGTAYAGLCRRESLTLHYAPLAADNRPEDTPVAPYGLLETTVLFHISRPKPTRLTQDDQSSQTLQGDCTRLPRSTDGSWFEADDEDSAVRGHFALVAAVARLKAGTLTPKPCPGDYAEKSCTDAIIEAADTDRYSGITRCPFKRCYIIYTGGMTVTVTLKDAMEAPGPADVEAVEVEPEQDIVV